MKCKSNSFKNIPLLYTCNSIITEINNEFTILTGYYTEELKFKTIDKVFEILKINFEKIKDHDRDCYLFTKSNDPVGVSISIDNLNGNNEKIYYFNEMENSDLENKFIAIDRLLLDNNIGIGIHYSEDLILLKANPLYMNLLGTSYGGDDLILGRELSKFAFFEEENRAVKIWRDVINTGKTFYGKEMRGISINSNYKYFNLTVIPVIENNKTNYIISMVEDVSEKFISMIRNEEQASIIEHQNKQLETIFKSMSEGVIAVDKDERVVLMNNEIKKYLYSSTAINNLIEINEKTSFTDIHGNIIPYEDLPLQRALKGETVRNCKTVIHMPDKEFFVECNSAPIYDNNDNIIMALLCNHDISEQIQYEKKLKDQHDFLYGIIDTLELPLLRLSYPDLIIIDINQKAFEIAKSIGTEIESTSQIKNRKITELFSNFYTGENYEYINKAVKERKTACLGEIRYLLNGNEAFGKVIYEPIFSLSGDIKELNIIFIDITNEIKANKSMEKTLQQQEEFFANISHELRTPINVLFTAIQMIEHTINKQNHKGCTVNKYIKMMKQNCFRLLKLVNNIIDISKIEAGYFNISIENHDIVRIVEDITLSVIDYAKNKNIEIIFDTDVEEKVIACDPNIIERIMLNLISNSIKFTSPGDKIFVDIKDLDNKIVIKVKDTGIGIPEDKQAMIFERFRQVDKSLSRSNEGSGIGLSLVKLLVKMIDGDISVASKSNEGSEFIIVLPVKVIKMNNNKNSTDLISRNVDIINIEFSDIYS